MYFFVNSHTLTLFQFHKGTIKTLFGCRVIARFRWFQFHKGTIKTEWGTDKCYSWCLFQFHKGTIKTNTSFVPTPCNLLFQFHKGTIKTTYRQFLNYPKEYFNSIKVRLKLSFANIEHNVRNFNSIKVRLKHLSHRHMFTAQIFQFHKGTIKT